MAGKSPTSRRSAARKRRKLRIRSAQFSCWTEPSCCPKQCREAAILLLRQQGQLRFGAKPVTGVPASYAGMEREALLRTAECLRAGGVGWLGLGMRLGELCMDEDFYPAIFAQLAALAQTLYEKTGAAADAIDLGDGLWRQLPARLFRSGAGCVRQSHPDADTGPSGSAARPLAANESRTVPRRSLRNAGHAGTGCQAGACSACRAGCRSGAVSAPGQKRRIPSGVRSVCRPDGGRWCSC